MSNWSEGEFCSNINKLVNQSYLLVINTYLQVEQTGDHLQKTVEELIKDHIHITCTY